MELKRRFHPLSLRCPLCRAGLVPWHARRRCHACRLAVHSSCARELSHRCPVLGCEGRLRRPRRRPKVWVGVAQGALLWGLSLLALGQAMLGFADVEALSGSLSRADLVWLRYPPLAWLALWFVLGFAALERCRQGLSRP